MSSREIGQRHIELPNMQLMLEFNQLCADIANSKGSTVRDGVRKKELSWGNGVTVMISYREENIYGEDWDYIPLSGFTEIRPKSVDNTVYTGDESSRIVKTVAFFQSPKVCVLERECGKNEFVDPLRDMYDTTEFLSSAELTDKIKSLRTIKRENTSPERKTEEPKPKKKKNRSRNNWGFFVGLPLPFKPLFRRKQDPPQSTS